jgi:hypothetical protein
MPMRGEHQVVELHQHALGLLDAGAGAASANGGEHPG